MYPRLKPGTDHVITRSCLEGGTRVGWLTMTNLHVSMKHICFCEGWMIEDRYYINVCELHVQNLRAGSLVCHAREKRRAKQSSGKKSGEEAPRKCSNALVLWTWAGSPHAGDMMLGFNFNTQMRGVVIRDFIHLVFYDVSRWNQSFFYLKELCHKIQPN